MRQFGSVFLHLLAGAGLPLLALLTGFGGMNAVAGLYEFVGHANRWTEMLSMVLVPTSVIAFYLLPAVGTGIVVSARKTGTAAWRTLGLLAIGLIPGAALVAWFYTDDVQGGIQMDAQWVRWEFLSIFYGALKNDLALIAALVAGTKLARRFRKSPPTQSPERAT